MTKQPKKQKKTSTEDKVTRLTNQLKSYNNTSNRQKGLLKEAALMALKDMNTLIGKVSDEDLKIVKTAAFQLKAQETLDLLKTLS